MLIIVLLYVGAAWLLFFCFKLLPWNWPWRIVTVLLGVAIVAIFIALLNTLTPSGRIAANIDTPKGIDPDMLRLGMVGTATVISDKAGPIGFLATILLWLKAYAAYL